MNPDGARRHKGQGKPVVCNSRSKNERCRQDFNVKDIANPRVLALARRDFFALALVIIKAMGNAAVKGPR
jgi:hypothetical protein